MKISFITTVFNEAKTIDKFLESLFNQSKLPNEIVIVDGMSTDKTVDKIKRYQSKLKGKKVTLKLLIKKGNRSVGRNEAITHAAGDIIVCSDAGNTLDKDWLKYITKPFADNKVDIVSGYYKPITKNIFQKCLATYTCVMPDRIDENNFLPSSRSIAFTKKAWKSVGGYPEYLNTCEDLIFAENLKKRNYKFIFEKKAIVYWQQRKNFREAFIQFFNYAKGDGEALYFRPQTPILFLRYFLGVYFIIFSLFYRSFLSIALILIGLIFYLLWAIKKNYRYVSDIQAITLLPQLQFTADGAVLLGTVSGMVKRIIQFRYFSYIRQNLFLFFIVLFYISIVLLNIQRGVPNQNHPFPYHMDEWHQFMAMKAILKEGTTTIPGAAQIPFLYPVISGIYLLPFIVFQVINPFSMRSPLDHLTMQEQLFQILRSVNIFFGIASVWLIARIAKKYLATSYILPVFFFVVSPILLMTSGYFKYDVGLLFFIILSLAAFYKFGETPSLRNFIYVAIACGLAFSVKFSAIPLLPLLIFAFFLFIPKKKRNYRWVLLAIIFFILTFLLIGSPNILIGRADYRELLYSNLVAGPKGVDNYKFYHSWLEYLLLKQYSIVFGHVLYFVGMLTALFLAASFFLTKNIRSLVAKNRLFLLISFFLFYISLLPLKIGASGNRALVLLPFLSLFAGIGLTHVFKKVHSFSKLIFIVVLVVIMTTQFFETLAWVYIRFTADPQKEASIWIEQHIKKGETIGVENIPIYQFLPNEIVKEFYDAQYHIKAPANYHYKLVSATSKDLPTTIIITNGNLEKRIFRNSQKNDLLDRLEKEGYKPRIVFSQDLGVYRLFISDIDYYMSALIILPLNIAVFEK